VGDVYDLDDCCDDDEEFVGWGVYAADVGVGYVGVVHYYSASEAEERGEFEVS
jgi:hypothetical protein